MSNSQQQQPQPQPQQQQLQQQQPSSSNDGLTSKTNATTLSVNCDAANNVSGCSPVHQMASTLHGMLTDMVVIESM